MAEEPLIFVYGTLKEGFRNFHFNRGRRVGGEFVTTRPHGLFIVGPYRLPWLLEDARPVPGHAGTPASAVAGQLFAVDDEVLAAMDALERVSEPGWYLRRRIAVRERGNAAAAAITAWVYFGSREGLEAGGAHLGPLAEYTLEHQEMVPQRLWASAHRQD